MAKVAPWLPVGGGVSGPRTPPHWTVRDVRRRFERWQVAEPERAQELALAAPGYLEYHAVRYARLMSAVDAAVALRRSADTLRILDVGPSVETVLLRAAHPAAAVDTLGFAHPAIPPRANERHIEFDLNDAPSASRPQPSPSYDLILLAEVVEHLYTPLSTVLSWVAGWLRPNGCVVVQTPNGAALHKRVRLLLGRSPVEPPRASRENPGHFHEYTIAELRQQVAASNLVLEWIHAANHFGPPNVTGRLYRGLGQLLPPALRHGVTLCARLPR